MLKNSTAYFLLPFKHHKVYMVYSNPFQDPQFPPIPRVTCQGWLKTLVYSYYLHIHQFGLFFQIIGGYTAAFHSDPGPHIYMLFDSCNSFPHYCPAMLDFLSIQRELYNAQGRDSIIYKTWELSFIYAPFCFKCSDSMNPQFCWNRFHMFPVVFVYMFTTFS